MTVDQRQVIETAGGRAARPNPIRGWTALLLCAGWLASVLLLDGSGGLLTRAWLVGSGWLVLAVLVRGRDAEERWQCLAVMVYALAIELVFSAGLHTYVYRMAPVAPYVVPGHGAIFLTALALSREPALRRRGRVLALATAAVGFPLAIQGLLGPRHDELGVVWAVCFAYFALRGRRPLLYAATFWLALGLEHAGVGVGAWSWATHDQIVGLMTMGNPPSVPGGGYVWLDAGGLVAGSWIAARLRKAPAKPR